MIPYARPSIDISDRQAVEKVLMSQWLTQGPIVEEFENAVCEYTGAKYCVAVSSGTAALDIACSLLDVDGLPVYSTSAITFVASMDAIVKNKMYKNSGNLGLADIDLQTYNAAAPIYMPVELAGRPVDRGYIIDSAHSFNRNMKMDQCGCRILSFHAIKNIATGEGGAIITENEGMANLVRYMRSHCKLEDDYVYIPSRDGSRASPLCIGGHYRMSCIQAALGLSQIKRADLFKERKAELTERYNIAFNGMDEIITPLPHDGAFWHLYIIRCENRDGLQEYLKECEIETRIHYKPIYRWSRYKDVFPDGHENMPNAEEYYRTALSLPLYADMNDEQQDYVIDCVKAFYTNAEVA